MLFSKKDKMKQVVILSKLSCLFDFQEGFNMTKLVRFDWAIKYLLRNKANFDILEGFLAELLQRDIRIESILESEGNKNTREDKFNRVDLLVINEKDEKIIIEVQTTSQWDYLSRILYGTSKIITEHLQEGSQYRDICKVISVSIVFFNMGQGEDYIYQGSTVFKGRHSHDTLLLNENERNLYGLGVNTPTDIYPEFYVIKVNQFRERIKDKFDEWVYFLKNEQVKSTFKAKGIHSAAEKLNILKLNKEDRQAYERYQENLHYEASMLASHYGMGEKKGHAEILIKQLEKKFGAVLEKDRERIMQASKGQLLEWAEKIFDIKEVGELFND